MTTALNVMTEKPDRSAPRWREVVVRLPLRDTEVVGAELRPPRMVTVGRRPSDRWAARAAIATFVAMFLFVLVVSYQLAQVTTVCGVRP